MLKSKKRKSDGGGEPEELPKRPSVSCILHCTDSTDLDFMPLSQSKGPIAQKLALLHTIRDRRLSEPIGSAYRMEDVCKLIPDEIITDDLDTIGYHRGCYQKFTKNQDRLKCNTSSEVVCSSTSRSPRKVGTSSNTAQLFPPECIFCDKIETKISGKTERCIQFPYHKIKDGSSHEPAWKQIEPRALQLQMFRLHRLVQGEDLFAREANFHQACRKAFNLKVINYTRDKIRAESSSTKMEHDCKATAHKKAFAVVLDYIQDHVIGLHEVIQLATLRLLYIQELEKNGFPNPQYRAEKLKTKLDNHMIHEFIAFAKVNPGDRGFITYTLVYSAGISAEDAVAHAYKLGSKDKFEEVAMLLRGIIQRAFKASPELPWPPTADDLDIKSADHLPAELLDFLNYVISGEADLEKCQTTRRIVLSIGQVRV